MTTRLWKSSNFQLGPKQNKWTTSKGKYRNYVKNNNIKFGVLLILVIALFSAMSSAEKIVSLDFEVFGRVQGVFFRKYTEQQAKKLGLRGWCMNTRQDTVKGVLEGNPNKVAEMKTWLQRTGSPQSRIDKAVFTNERDIAQYTFDTFSVKR